MEIEYWLEKEVQHAYHTSTKRWVVSKEDFIRHYLKVSAKNTSFYGVVSTAIDRRPTPFSILPILPRRWRYDFTYFMLLDCDSQENAIAAAACLKRDGINWVSIESSPDHFWLITDYIGNFRQIIEKMGTIVGVDPNYFTLTAETLIPYIRATPTVGRVPQIENNEDINKLRDKRVVNWLKQYQQLIQDQELVLQNTILVNALEKGQIYELVSDPEFEI